MFLQYKKLDNPAWHALTETHAGLALGNDVFKRYRPGIVLFAGFDLQQKNIFKDIDDVFAPSESFFLFDEYPALPTSYVVETIVECVQMVCEEPEHVSIAENIRLLDKTNYTEMFELVSQVFPGYYLFDTPLMGDYYGIFKEGRLVSMAGERLCMHGLTEISAVVTHPEHVGNKYAQQLVAHLNDKNMQDGNIPFLHTGSNNERAISIYELLGYKKRRIIPVTKIKRVAE